jgi:hypothetical protein
MLGAAPIAAFAGAVSAVHVSEYVDMVLLLVQHAEPQCLQLPKHGSLGPQFRGRKRDSWRYPIVGIDWQMIREIVAPTVGVVGGLVGLFGGGLGIYYASTANRILLKRFRREEEAKEVETRADDLMRRAHEAAACAGGSVMQMVPFELTDEIDKRAAWKLCKEGRARMQGKNVTVDVDLLPKMIARDMARRGHSSQESDD